MKMYLVQDRCMIERYIERCTVIKLNVKLHNVLINLSLVFSPKKFLYITSKNNLKKGPTRYDFESNHG